MIRCPVRESADLTKRDDGKTTATHFRSHPLGSASDAAGLLRLHGLPLGQVVGGVLLVLRVVGQGGSLQRPADERERVCASEWTEISTQAQIIYRLYHIHRLYHTLFLYEGRGKTHAAHLLTLRKKKHFAPQIFIQLWEANTNEGIVVHFFSSFQF